METFFLVAGIGLCSLVFSGFFAWIVSEIRDRSFIRRMTYLESEITRIEARYKGNAGNAAKAEREERMGEAMAAAMAGIKSGKPPMEVLQDVATAYPDVAMSLLKKGKLGI